MKFTGKILRTFWNPRDGWVENATHGTAGSSDKSFRNHPFTTANLWPHSTSNTWMLLRVRTQLAQLGWIVSPWPYHQQPNEVSFSRNKVLWLCTINKSNSLRPGANKSLHRCGCQMLSCLTFEGSIYLAPRFIDSLSLKFTDKVQWSTYS